MKKNDIIELEIERQGMEGEGIARHEGMVVFVPYTLAGERVKAEVVFVKKKFARAKVIKVLRASADRVTPPCPVYFRCGGCQLQHIRPEKHKEIKIAHIQDCFQKNAGLDLHVDAYIEDAPFGYRNKVQLPVAMQNGRVVVGYYKENTHTVIPFETCLLHGQWAERFIKVFLHYANTQNIRVYDERTGTGILRHLVLRKVGGHVFVSVVICADTLPQQEHLLEGFKALGTPFSLHLSIHKKQTNLIMGDVLKTVYGNDAVDTQIMGVACSVSPLAFMQINDVIFRKIYEKLLEGIQAARPKTVIDAFSGIGITTNLVAEQADQVYGIEIVKEAYLDAEKTRRGGKYPDKIVNILGDCANELPKLLSDLKEEECAVILDPPRKGCAPEVMAALLETLPKDIFYISCNPATLARDCALILEKYKICEATAFDMFPNTSHVETLVWLQKNTI